MKRTNRIIAFVIIANILSGCSYTDTTIQLKSTSFVKSKVEKEGITIVSKGEVNVYDSYGVVLAIEVSEDTSGTLNILYTKNDNELEVFQDWKEISSLEKTAVSNNETGDIAVELNKGKNNFIISGEECTCEYTVTFCASDISKVIGYDGGFLIPHE